MRVTQSVTAVLAGEIGSQAVVDKEVLEKRKQAHASHRSSPYVGMDDGTFDEGFGDGRDGGCGFLALF